MNTPSKLTFIVTIALAGFVFAASCSKEPKKSGEKRERKNPAVTNPSSAFSQGKDSLNAVRNGQYVDLNWQIDTTGRKIQRISITRSSIGVDKQKKVAELDGKVTSYRDCLPDEKAYWYVVQLFTPDGKLQKVGPVRVDMDGAGATNYINQEEGYKTSITRTDEFATLKWDFPEGAYTEIRIFRYTRPVAELSTGQLMGKKKGASVTISKERKSQYKDALPDSNSDYWYWFRVTLKSGAVIDRGPIKAGYAGQ